MELRDKILADPINKWIFSYSENNVFLVGGYIRDLIIGRKSVDRDYVVSGNTEKLVRNMAAYVNGKVIHISRHNIFRVVTKKGEFIDFTLLTGTIKTNLKKRDFSINAIAWSPENGFIDPLNGIKDIRDRIIRVANKKSFSDDPLRCLRVFRLAADLDFIIEDATLLSCNKYRKQLSAVSEERKTDEMVKLLSNFGSTSNLDLMLKVNVLSELISLNRMNIKLNIDMLRSFDRFISEVALRHIDLYNALNLKEILDFKISQGIKRIGLMRISLLTFNKKSNKIPLNGLMFSKIIQKKIQLIHSALKNVNGRITQKKLYGIFTMADDCSEEIGLLLSMMKNDHKLGYVKRAQQLRRFINENKVNGFDIKRVMNIDNGKYVGHIKEEINRRWFIGELSTKRQIISFIRSNLT